MISKILIFSSLVLQSFIECTETKANANKKINSNFWYLTVGASFLVVATFASFLVYCKCYLKSILTNWLLIAFFKHWNVNEHSLIWPHYQTIRHQTKTRVKKKLKFKKSTKPYRITQCTRSIPWMINFNELLKSHAIRVPRPIPLIINQNLLSSLCNAVKQSIFVNCYFYLFNLFIEWK